MSAKVEKIEYERKPSVGWYRGIRVFFWLIFHSLWPLKIVGKDNVPQSGSALIVSNHLSMVDPFVVCFGAHRLVSFMGKEELFRTPLVGFLVRKLGAFPVDRSRRDPASMRIALTLLKDGELLGMFPEGSRSATGELQELRAGAARLASRTRAPIVPVAVVNTDHALPPGKFLRPARISVVFGEPFELTELYEKPKDEEAMARALILIKEKIEQLHV
ncbi:MAG: lysophospholipid acyltransferase family protein [Chloroflexia bacterium]